MNGLLRLVACFVLAAAPAAAGEWRQLFNGKDLEGWTVKIRGHELGKNYADTFRVEDGLLKVRFDGYEGRFRGRFGHLFYNEPMSEYRLRVEYRVVGEQAPGGPRWANRNSGVMIHGQPPQTMAIDQQFPVSLEVQLLGGQGAGDRPTANLCTPGTNVVMRGALVTEHCNSSTSKTYDGDQWVTVEIEVRGGKALRHFVNGDQVLEYSEPQLDPRDPDAQKLLESGADKLLTGGTISLQAESHPFDFRKIEIMPLE